jgi:hypothetical protein
VAHFTKLLSPQYFAKPIAHAAIIFRSIRQFPLFNGAHRALQCEGI